MIVMPLGPSGQPRSLPKFQGTPGRINDFLEGNQLLGCFATELRVQDVKQFQLWLHASPKTCHVNSPVASCTTFEAQPGSL